MEAAGKKIGQLFIISFPESLPSDDTLYFIQDNHIGGVILFAQHCRDLESLQGWLKDVKRAWGDDFIIAVDQEGGRVRRFTRGFPPLEPPRQYAQNKNLKRYCDDLAHVCERLKEIGVNLNLVPVVDLFAEGAGHVLDSRAFSDDPSVVAEFALATLNVHHEHGLLTCAKHFPGLGRSSGDPHQVLANCDLTEAEFFERELKPFETIIEQGVDAVMVTHLAAPKVDDYLSITSEKIISGWLKDALAFSGPAITDDLLMEGASLSSDPAAVTIKAFAAGADFLLFGQELKKTKEVLARFTEAWQNGQFDPLRKIDAHHRVEEFKRRIEV